MQIASTTPSPAGEASPAAQSIIDALPSPIIVVDAGNRIAFANAAAEEFFAASVMTLKRFGLDDIVPFSSPLSDLIAQARLGQSSINEYGVSIGTPRSGGERRVDVQVAAMPERTGSVVLVLQKRSMAQKIDRQLTHRAAARTVTGMASMLAHEIKNPLSGIRGAAQLIEPALGEDDRPLASLICAETDRIRNLVDQMEVFSDERPIERAPVNIHDVFDHVKMLAKSGFARGVTIREFYDPSLPPVLGHRDQLVQVFVNLVKNAAEAIAETSGQGEITLQTAFRPGVRLTMPGTGERLSLPLELSVHDTGPGISEDIGADLFDPFISTKPNGKGLGLALVAKIVRDHGGVVEWERAGRITTFRVLMPMHDEGTGPADRQARP
jgi:two-component system nitrogen regulation sensor histidine kinase GlnL